jgi:hypothetical protein
MAYPFAPVKDWDQFRRKHCIENDSGNNPNCERQTRKSQKASEKPISDKPSSK